MGLVVVYFSYESPICEISAFLDYSLHVTFELLN